MKRWSSILSATALTLAALALPAHAAPDDSPVKEVATDALWWGDFTELERQNALYKQPGRVDPDGTSQLELFRKGLLEVFENEVKNSEAYLSQLDTLTLQWAKARPASALAHILHAQALVQHGWSYRGRGYADKVSPEAWKEFIAYQQRALQYLKEHADVAFTDSYAHYVMLQIGRGLGWAPKQMMAIADEGVKRNPNDVNLYSQVAFGLLPKWGGTPRLLDDYIKQVTERTRAAFGMGMYARLYSAAADDQFGHALFENSFADWNKIKQGYEDTLARYPNNPLRMNRYAYLACLAKDKDTFLRLLDKLGEGIELSEWGSNPERSLEGCRRWALAS